MTFFSFLFKKKFPNAATRESLAQGPITVWKAVVVFLFAALIAVLYLFIIKANEQTLVTVPAKGGTIVEGIIGAPRAIDPLAAVTDSDVALTHLVFAGLTKLQEDGTVVPELAREFSVSPDGKTYTFTLRDDLVFSDKSPLTATDVLATITALQDPVANPRSSTYWQQVTVSTPDATTVVASLPAPEDTFLEHMAVGIMSAKALNAEETSQDQQSSPIDLNPLGAGPFKLVRIEYDASGAPRVLHFVRNRHYPLGTPLLSGIDIAVYANQETLLSALAHGDIDLTFALLPETLTPKKLPTNATFTAIPSARSVSLWGLDSSTLASGTFRSVANRFIDKNAIVATMQNGFGIAPAELSEPLSFEEALDMLADSGYTESDGVLRKGGTPVSISVATLNTPTLLSTAQALTQSLTALGAVTQVLAFDQGNLSDALAEQKLPLVLSDGTFPIPSAYREVLPLYTVSTVLAADSRIHGIPTTKLLSPTLRYAQVATWHTKTDKVWRFLVRNR